MRKLIIAALSCLVLLSFFMDAKARQTPPKEDSLDKAKEFFFDGAEEQALEIYLDILKNDSLHYEALWNTVIIYSNKGDRQENEDRREEFMNKSIEWAEKLMEEYPDKGHAHYAYAVALGRKTDWMGNRDRIQAAHEIRDHSEKASILIPDFAPVWHLYGVWHSDVANVSRGARLAARFLSGGLPDGSNEKAEEYLLKAIEMDPENILARLDLARHYMKVGRDKDAKSVVEETLEMEPRMKDDPAYQEEAREMLENLD